jgi:hypothetical protein
MSEGQHLESGLATPAHRCSGKKALYILCRLVTRDLSATNSRTALAGGVLFRVNGIFSINRAFREKFLRMTEEGFSNSARFLAEIVAVGQVQKNLLDVA